MEHHPSRTIKSAEEKLGNDRKLIDDSKTDKPIKSREAENET